MGENIKKKEKESIFEETIQIPAALETKNIYIDSEYTSNYDRLFSGQLSSQEEAYEFDLEEIYDPTFQESIYSAKSAPNSAVEADIERENSPKITPIETKSAQSSKRFFGSSKAKSVASNSAAQSQLDTTVGDSNRIVDLTEKTSNVLEELPAPEEPNFLCKNSEFEANEHFEDLLMENSAAIQGYSIDCDADLRQAPFTNWMPSLDESQLPAEFWSHLNKDPNFPLLAATPTAIFMPLINWQYAKFDGKCRDHSALLNVEHLLNSFFYFQSSLC